MKPSLVLPLAAALALPPLGAPAHADSAAPPPAHREARFTFTADAPLAEVAPLFGADRERVWSPDWAPRFIHPAPAADQRGMVFTVGHADGRESIWVNTELDLARGRVQYVYVIPGALVTVITLRLSPRGRQTRVDVEYDRTALSAEANAHLAHLSDADSAAGPEWERRINGYLHRRNARAR